jgi:hypothetical protein
LARAFAAADPKTVIGYLDDQDEELRLRGTSRASTGGTNTCGNERRGSPSRVSGRGLEQEAEMLRKEIARLRTLVSTAAYDLKAAGQGRKGQRLLRALEGH